MSTSPIKNKIATFIEDVSASKIFKGKFGQKITKIALNRFSSSVNQPPSEPITHTVSPPPKFPSIQLSPTSSITFNPKTKQYIYTQLAPPIENLVISGGGAKGVMLPGILQAFEEHDEGGICFRDQLKNIAGSSVGALSGALIASGITAEDFIASTKNSDFKALLGKGKTPILKDGAPLIDFVRAGMQSSIKKQLLAMGDPKGNVKGFVTEQIAKNGGNCTEEEIDQITEQIERVYQAIEAKDINNVKITFSMLSALRELNPAAFKDLTITATCNEDGKTYYFNADKTPELDIAIACRASASLPVILKPVKIDQNLLLPGYPANSQGNSQGKFLHFVDGCYFDNIPVNSLNDKQTNPLSRGDQGQNLQTLALVFDDSKLGEGEQSPFHNVASKKHALYDSTSLKERFIRDIFAKHVVNIRTKERNTVRKEMQLEEIRTKYTQRNIPLASSLRSTDFAKAKKREDEFIKYGHEQGKNYLDNHSQELIYHEFNSLDALLEQMPAHEIQAHWEELQAFNDVG